MGGVRDGFSNFKFYDAIGPRSTLGLQITGGTLDRQGYETVTFVATINADVSGVTSASTITYFSNYFLRMQHGESNAAGNVVWSNCQASNMLIDMTYGGTLSGLSVTSYGWLQTTSCGSGIDEGICLHFGVGQSNWSAIESQGLPAGYVGTRRWVRVILSASAAADVSAVGINVLCIMGLPGQWPVNDIKRDVTTG